MKYQTFQQTLANVRNWGQTRGITINGTAMGQAIKIDAAALLRSLQAENEALRVDAERYRWLRRNLVGLSFSDSLIASLCKDQSELDAAMKGEPHAD